MDDVSSWIMNVSRGMHLQRLPFEALLTPNRQGGVVGSGRCGPWLTRRSVARLSAGDGWGTTTERHHWRMSTGPQPSITAATNCPQRRRPYWVSWRGNMCLEKKSFIKKIWMILATMPRSFILHNVQNLCMKTMQPHMYNIVWYHVRGVTDMYFKWCLGVPRCACVQEFTGWRNMLLGLWSHPF